MAMYEVLTNAQLLERYNERRELIAELKQLEEKIRPVQARISAIESRLESIGDVTDVIKGVCLRVRRDDRRRWTDARTLGVSGAERRINLYRRVDTEFWAVRVYKEVDYKEQYYGGRVIGLSKNLTYRQVVAIARRWLLGDDTVLAKGGW